MTSTYVPLIVLSDAASDTHAKVKPHGELDMAMEFSLMVRLPMPPMSRAEPLPRSAAGTTDRGGQDRPMPALMGDGSAEGDGAAAGALQPSVAQNSTVPSIPPAPLVE